MSNLRQDQCAVALLNAFVDLGWEKTHERDGEYWLFRPGKGQGKEARLTGLQVMVQRSGLADVVVVGAYWLNLSQGVQDAKKGQITWTVNVGMVETEELEYQDGQVVEAEGSQTRRQQVSDLQVVQQTTEVVGRVLQIYKEVLTGEGVASQAALLPGWTNPHREVFGEQDTAEAERHREQLRIDEELE